MQSTSKLEELKEVISKQNAERKLFHWLNTDSRKFLEGDYLVDGQSAEERYRYISETAERILGIEGFADKFYNYLGKGYYSLSTPILTNFGLERGYPISCVVGDTWINTDKGGKMAKDIEIGDMVLTHKNRYRPVVAIIPTEKKNDIYRFKVENHTAELFITGNHPILTNKGWVRLDELVKGEHEIATIINGVDGFNQIDVLEKTDRVEDVWDFTVEEDHSFVCDGVVVHNCYGSMVEDSIDGIFTTLHEVAMMNKTGGGTSAYFGKVRPRGSSISHENGKSNGTFSFLTAYDSTVNVVNQGSARRGMMAAYIDIDHGDIEEWLNIHTEGNPIQNIYYGVNVRNKWLEEMKAGDKYKRDIWAKLLKVKRQTGIPYINFIDNVNNNKPDVYRDKNIPIYASNLCVAPDTTILTDKGHEVIGDIVGQKRTIWNGAEWSENVEIVKTGENRPLLLVTLSDGKYLKCTLEHKWSVVDTYGGAPRIVQTQDLKVGDKLEKWAPPVIDGAKVLEHAYTNGFYSGDGCELSANDNSANVIYLYGEKQKLRPYITTDVISDNVSYVNNSDDLPLEERVSRMVVRTRGLRRKFFVPSVEYTVDSRLEWLAGYLDADGCVHRNGTNEALTACSINYSFLKNVADMLQTLGIQSKITKMRGSGYNSLPINNGTGGYKEYQVKPAYRLLITSHYTNLLMELGLKDKLHRLVITGNKPQRSAEQFVTVKAIALLDGLHDTYCVTEPKQHKAVFNGILTHQCNEISLPSSKDWSFVCCLMSMNLNFYNEWKDTDAVETAIYFLDAVMTEFINKADGYPGMHKAVRFAREHRALGLGVLGWHSYLQSEGVAFDSFRAMRINNEVFRNIRQKANIASAELAQRFGEPELLKGYGRRNTTLMALAPTKSSSYILGQVSPSIEPLRSNYFVKDVAKNKSVYVNPALKVLLQLHGQDKPEVWDDIAKHDGSVQHLTFLSADEKNVFKTFSEISQMTIIQQAAQRQVHIDQAQSINVMFHPQTPIKDINALYLTAAELGVKGIYYQYSISAAQEFNRELATQCTTCEA